MSIDTACDFGVFAQLHSQFVTDALTQRIASEGQIGIAGFTGGDVQALLIGQCFDEGDTGNRIGVLQPRSRQGDQGGNLAGVLHRTRLQLQPPKGLLPNP